jgi:hypothetical protein
VNRWGLGLFEWPLWDILGLCCSLEWHDAGQTLFCFSHKLINGKGDDVKVNVKFWV